MNNLRDGIIDYLELRRSLGFKLKKDERLLLDFAAFMERRGATWITLKLALAWAQQPESTDPNYLAGRLRAIRSFARYRILTDPRTEIPPTDLLPRQRSTFQPHLFSQDEIARLLAATLQRRRGAKPISRWSRYTIFGLLSVTGMRVSEALSLDLEDVDLDSGVLTIRNSKFGKSRLVPVHATTCATLKLYLEQRNAFLAGASPGRSSYRRLAGGLRIRLWACRSVDCPGNSDCAASRMRRGRVCTICGTAWPSRSCGNAMAQARIPSAACRRCPLIWDTPISTTPTGICTRTLLS